MNYKVKLSLSRLVKKIIILSNDIILNIIATWISFCARFESILNPFSLNIEFFVLSILIYLFTLQFSNHHLTVIRYSNNINFYKLLRPIMFYLGASILLFTVIGVNNIPRSIGIIQPLIFIFFIFLSRYVAYLFFSKLILLKKNISNFTVVIVGAHESGQQLFRALTLSGNVNVIGFVEEDPSLLGGYIYGYPIYPLNELINIVDKYAVTDIFLSSGYRTSQNFNEALSQLKQIGVEIRSAPGILNLLDKTLSIKDFGKIDTNLLLHRDPVALDFYDVCLGLENKVVMVTGAGGSIGRELCKQLSKLKIKSLVMLDTNEFALYEICEELNYDNELSTINFISLLGSVLDESRLEQIFKLWNPEVIYHAAAYKHVPIVEENVVEGIKNNAMGTYSLVKVTSKYINKKLILVSTDKAVRPANFMGASKRIAEMIFQAYADSSGGNKNIYSMVRFGNVLGSSGSVVPKFTREIKNGGPVKITHPDVTRYFMTISEAAQLVIHASQIAKGGEVFFLEMGQSVKILDLAKRMIELYGRTIKDQLSPDGEIEIKIIGLRPGEKLHEELTVSTEKISTSHPKIKKVSENFHKMEVLKKMISELYLAIASESPTTIEKILSNYITDYKRDGVIVDKYTTSSKQFKH
jgi:FlaA1/EpsC-like NDP-sugar epimerase